MLKSLQVSNYAIIDEVRIDFTQGLNVLTGETGAGKSILLGALSLILGNRADKKVFYDASRKSIVEGVFDISALGLTAFFEQHDLDYLDETILRREVSSSGKSRAFINDTPVTLDVLRAFSAQLVDLHRQHDSLSVTGKTFQQDFLDSYAGCTPKSKAFGLQFGNYKKHIQQLEALKAEQAKTTQELDFWQFQYNELDKAQIQPGELEEKEVQLKNLQHAEEIQLGLGEVLASLENADGGIIDGLNNSLHKLRSLEKYLSQASGLANRFNSALLELEDITSSLQQLANTVQQDPEEFQALTERVDELNRLLSKHHVQHSDALITVFDELGEKIKAVNSFTEEINRLETSCAQQEKTLFALAAELSNLRKQAIPKLEEEVAMFLTQVGMPNSEIQVKLAEQDRLTSYGINEVDILFSANRGQAPQALKLAASGGELSRLMLALKSIIAGKTTLPTLIFDEIDTGISGEVAVQVGKLLSRMAQQHQLILITHLPQIASRGNSHHFIYKLDEAGATTSKIKTLNREERIVQIAEMLSGASPSDASLSAAKELLGLN